VTIALYHYAYSFRRYGYWHRTMMTMMMTEEEEEDYGIWVEETWPTGPAASQEYFQTGTW
jgi:hypothetical protein